MQQAREGRGPGVPGPAHRDSGLTLRPLPSTLAARTYVGPEFSPKMEITKPAAQRTEGGCLGLEKCTRGPSASASRYKGPAATDSPAPWDPGAAGTGRGTSRLVGILGRQGRGPGLGVFPALSASQVPPQWGRPCPGGAFQFGLRRRRPAAGQGLGPWRKAGPGAYPVGRAPRSSGTEMASDSGPALGTAAAGAGPGRRQEGEGTGAAAAVSWELRPLCTKTRLHGRPGPGQRWPRALSRAATRPRPCGPAC